MKRMYIMSMLMTNLAVPLMATAQGADMMGGARGGPMGGSSMTSDGASMMGGDRPSPNEASDLSAHRMSEGEVRKVDNAAGKLTLRHGPLENVDMPAMTMVFRVRDPAWLQRLRVGDKVRFVARRVDGKLTVTALEAEKQ